RWQTAHDVMLELKWIAEGGSQAGVPIVVGVRRKSRERIAWLFAALFFIAALLSTFAYIHFPKEQNRMIRFSIPFPEGMLNRLTDVSGTIAISPDGQHVAFAASSSNGKGMLWLRSLQSVDPRPLNGTEGALLPFWSPDNRHIGFFADGKLKKI